MASVLAGTRSVEPQRRWSLPVYLGTVGDLPLLSRDSELDTRNRGDIRQAILCLICTSFGSGTLAIPHALKESGLLGLVVVLLSALAAGLSMSVLMNATAATGLKSYGILAARTFGSEFGFLFDILLFMFGNGTIIANLILLDDFLPVGVLREILLGALIVLVPLSLKANLQAFRYISPLPFLSVAFTAFAVVWYSSGQKSTNVVYAQFGMGTFRSFSLSMYGYNCHLNVVPIANELDIATSLRVETVCMGTVFSQFIIYVFLATSGYLSFGSETQINILDNFGEGYFLISICRVSLIASVLLTIPVTMFSTVQSFLNVINRPRQDQRIQRVAVLLMLLIDVTIGIVLGGKAKRVIQFFELAIGAIIMLVLPACIQVRVIGINTKREKALASFLTLSGGLAFVSAFAAE